ncbi:D-amino acid dehydrogenase small subunit [Promicromonospora sp. AC04]|uniref:NAD(P)/FAD-dependent oxidoreductase n=1 Tax=Promicromonospora sp. AC04 TaxID=2135723 RepID=UPI000D343ED0|nr:FAD-dependent oxidoreductase [Promicromonospora sp. AC04]PUB30274.1 D-amino acid dehydrogenase small subunit [Promicromonospora sp. AC04]
MAETKSAIVVGAGMVGLATAWHLQERGVEVTVLDRHGVASGSSWGNAGWLTPGMAMPLADPSLWTYGPKAMLDPDAALSVPFRFDSALWGFVARFMAHATPGAWRRAMAALTPIDRLALEAYDELEAGGVHATSYASPWVIGFERERESRPFVHELRGVARAGQEVPLSRLPDGVRVPHLSPAVRSIWTLEGQRFIEPGPYAEALATSVSARGAKVLTDAQVTGVRRVAGGTEVAVSGHDTMTSDVVVIATGAWLPDLARQFGVRTRVQAGRGYSFSAPVAGSPIDHPVYFPARRVACTPYQGRLRIAGTMEFRGPDEPFQPRRVEAIVNSVRGLFEGVDLDSREDEWVGSRPVTPDGLPLVGRTAAPGVYVAGGHGMWGMVLGPATGRALATLITTGQTPEEIRPFDPLR